jgi:RNA-directed DNA polymerase
MLVRCRRSPPPKVGKLQTALHTKAKNSPGYRLYVLYDKLDREDILGHAYDRCRANGGAPGVDGQTFAQIEQEGLNRWLVELAEELRKGVFCLTPRKLYHGKDLLSFAG